LTGLSIKDGRLNFIDKKISPRGFLVRLDGIDLRISKVMLPPTSPNTKLSFSATVFGQEGLRLGAVEASGWVDFGPKDADVTLQVKDMEAAYFSPYYGTFISKKKLLSARLDLKSQLKAKNTSLDILSSLRLSGLVYAPSEPRAEGQLPSLDFTKNALDLFTDKEGNLNLDFSIKTELDDPKINVEELKKAILNAAVKNLSSQNPQDVMEKINDTIRQFKDFGKGMKDIFKEK
jgi:hypothetical protein